MVRKSSGLDHVDSGSDGCGCLALDRVAVNQIQSKNGTSDVLVDEHGDLGSGGSFSVAVSGIRRRFRVDGLSHLGRISRIRNSVDAKKSGVDSKFDTKCCLAKMSAPGRTSPVAAEWRQVRSGKHRDRQQDESTDGEQQVQIHQPTRQQ